MTRKSKNNPENGRFSLVLQCVFFFFGLTRKILLKKKPFEVKIVRIDSWGTLSFLSLSSFSSKISPGDKRAVSQKGGFGECTLVPVFVLGEHASIPSFWFSFRGNIGQNHPFGIPPLFEPPKIRKPPRKQDLTKPKKVRFENFPGTFCIVFTSKTGFQNQFRTPSRQVRKPHFLRFGLPEPLLKQDSTKPLKTFANKWNAHKEKDTKKSSQGRNAGNPPKQGQGVQDKDHSDTSPKNLWRGF